MVVVKFIVGTRPIDIDIILQRLIDHIILHRLIDENIFIIIKKIFINIYY